MEFKTRFILYLFHLTFFTIYLFGFVYVEKYIGIPNGTPNVTEGRLYAGHWKFLTHWDHTLQLLTFLMLLLVDVLSLIDHCNRNKIQKITDHVEVVTSHLFHSLSFPVGFFVTIFFWGLFTVDRGLVVGTPLPGEVYSPSWLNHIQHSLPLTLNLIESLIQEHERPRRHILGLTPLITFVLIYNTWMFHIGVNHGHWVYGIFEKLNWPLRILFGAGGVGVIVSFYILGHFVHKWRWLQRPACLSRKREPDDILIE